MQKLIVAVLLILAVLGAAYLVSLNRERGFGTVATTTPETQLNQYSSEEGVSFKYPAAYELSSRSEGNAERTWDVVVLLPRGYVPPQDGEGPPAISLSILNNTEGLSLEQWVRGDARSNWKLALDQGDLGSTTLGGLPALTYRYSGLYESSAVAAAHRGKIFLFQVGWLLPEDTIRGDFEKVLQSVTFI